MGTHPIFESDFDCLTAFRKIFRDRMESEPVFKNDSEAISYWKSLAAERQADFDELQEMNTDYEREMESQIEKLEKEKNEAQIQHARLSKEFEDYRDRQRQREVITHDEIEKLKTQVAHDTQQKNELMKETRTLEQELDDYANKYRQLHTSYEQSQELLQLEMERNAMLETDVYEKANLHELVQRLRDEKRDLKSEIEVREKLTKRETAKEAIKEDAAPRDLESRLDVDGGNGAVSTRRTPTLVTSSTTHPTAHSISTSTATTSSSSPSMSSIHSTSSSQSRLSALSIVGDLLRKVGALETKLASCRTFVRDNQSAIPNPSQVSTTPRRPVVDSALRSPLRATYTSPMRTSNSFNATPTRGQSRTMNTSASHESRIGERLANQRSLFTNGQNGMGNAEARLPNSKSIKLNAP